MPHLGLKWHTAEHVSWWHFNEIRKTMVELTNNRFRKRKWTRTEGKKKYRHTVWLRRPGPQAIEDRQGSLSVPYLLLTFLTCSAFPCLFNLFMTSNQTRLLSLL